jgi:hypothetical protein
MLVPVVWSSDATVCLATQDLAVNRKYCNLRVLQHLVKGKSKSEVRGVG